MLTLCYCEIDTHTRIHKIMNIYISIKLSSWDEHTSIRSGRHYGTASNYSSVSLERRKLQFALKYISMLVVNS